MTDDSKKPPRPDPFAPLPLPETLTGPTTKSPREPSAPTHVPEQAPAAAPLPPTAFTPRVSGEHDAPIAPFDASAYEAPPDPPAPDEPAPLFTPDPDEQRAPAPEALAAPAPASVVVEPGLVPTTYDENELRDAVGATLIPDDKKAKKKAEKKRRDSADDDDLADDEDRPRSRWWLLVAALAIVIGGGITSMILVGRSNSERYLIACEADRVVLLQGRSFPPWGETSLDGAEWKPLKIPAEAPCAPFETKNKAELAARFGKLLEERATKLVGGRGGTSTPTSAAGPEDPVAKVDEAEAALKQALLVARWLGSDNERITKREDLERLLGDVTYWRASARLRAAADALTDAAKQFDAAALQRPRANTDAGEWATHSRKLADQLRAGPSGEQTAFPPMPPTDTQTSTAPTGVALPVEPPPTDTGSDAPPPIDAGVPSGGGVLL